MFITLTKTDNSKITINFDHVDSIEEYKENTIKISIINKDCSLFVYGNIKALLKLLNSKELPSDLDEFKKSNDALLGSLFS